MKRRGLFGFLAAAPVGVAGAVGASIVHSNEKPSDNVMGISFFHTGDVRQDRMLLGHNNDDDGKITVYKGRLWLYNRQNGWKVIA